jgi:predicted Ser/Thr protein kinase
LKLGRYEIVRELGKGAMGIVYLAKDPLIGRLVALKTIRIAGNTDDEEAKEFQQRFVREAQAAGILNHPSIVTVHDIGQAEDGTSFIAMEFVEGQNLKEVLTQGRPLSFDQLGDLVAQVAEGLDFAHAKGIVHRDVKPANIIVLDGNRAKITDFGIAKIAEGGANLTSTGQFLGTPNYMAPEQVKGAPVDGRTDIFSLGICLYECLTRRKPFGGDSLTSISYKIVHEPFPPLQELNPQIPEGYEAVVAGCLAKEPARRYQRARDVANAIRAVIRGEKPSSLSDVTSVEETMITREQKLPTMDVPFPEATTGRAPGSASPATSAGLLAGGGTLVGKVAQEGTEAARLLMTGVTRVGSMPIWRRRLPPALFFGVIAVLAAMLLGAVTILRGGQVEVPAVDTAAESRRARERSLRLEANSLLRQGRVVEAYAKFYELQRLAPNSSYVSDNLQKLGAIQQQEEISKQQLAEADLMFQEGVVLLDQRNYGGAIELFREALRLNPNYVAATEHLEFALSEQQRVEGATAANRRNLDLLQQSTDAGGSETRAGQAGAARGSGTRSTAAPVQLTTTFSHPFTEGQMVVRVGGDVLLNEPLFEERQNRFRRSSRVAREINLARTFPAKNADVQVWVTVPGSNIQEHHTIEAVRFEAGGSHALIVRFDPGSRRFSYELN